MIPLKKHIDKINDNRLFKAACQKEPVMKIKRIEEKCIHCMRCVDDCVSGVWRNVDNIPTVVAPDSCNLCSHCVAVCPKKAIVHDDLDDAQIRRVARKKIDSNVYKEIVISRRSVRQYQIKPLSREDLEDIINLARYSPTASNSQHVGYIVISDKNRLDEISKIIFSTAKTIYDWSSSKTGKFVFSGLKMNSGIAKMMEKYIEPMEYYMKLQESGRDLILHNAPALIVLHAPALSFFASDNCNIAAANICNYAHSKGLGTCFIGFVTLSSRFNKKLCSIMELPKNRKVYASLVIGHPKYPHPYTGSRKKIDISWLSD
jgi:nitroreductase/NAD-dependent dihydropyrimidine dehydrogenase PreA subunit